MSLFSGLSNLFGGGEDDLKGFLQSQDLSDAFGPLQGMGVKKVSDLSELEENDVQYMPLPPISKKKLIKIVQHAKMSQNMG
eukprot:CAMPEP_0181323452 /NCGR_PEP_ID=MMETSP1101-20121128/19794_1 /TAXON_ID=46948 /ORGANISM="Rhodomonas abbreviata, Strain Caron Lab Isolate" /LENGTH=80 /DNA_ID=CAMNT_0023431483 /DNA_START=212 /DNA_END=450 /DNA_ORIENTATION=+